MDEIMAYIKPELLAVSVVLYLLGTAFEKTRWISARYLPFTLCGAGVVICGIWVLSTSQFSGIQSVLLAVFTSVIQGVLVAGLSIGGHQLLKIKDKK